MTVALLLGVTCEPRGWCAFGRTQSRNYYQCCWMGWGWGCQRMSRNGIPKPLLIAASLATPPWNASVGGGAGLVRAAVPPIQSSWARRGFGSRVRWRPVPLHQQQSLPRPTVLYESNHLLAIDKPPGWHSIPHNTNNNNATNETRTTNPSEQREPSTNDSNSTKNKNQENDTTTQNINNNTKCLLTHLTTERRLGGGSQRHFLKPLHRLDQPCSGILLLGRTTKAASRIQSQWSTVHKVYYVMVHNDINIDNEPYHPPRNRQQQQKQQQTIINQELVPNLATSSDGADARLLSEWQPLQGFMVRRRSHFQNRSKSHTLLGSSKKQGSSEKGWSVTMLLSEDVPSDKLKEPQTVCAERRRESNHASLSHLRHCVLEYRIVQRQQNPLSNANGSGKTKKPLLACFGSMSLLEVRTKDGARHVIRALLACHGMPVVGDLRYGADGDNPNNRSHSKSNDNNSSSREQKSSLVLDDQSVALHAYSLQLPPSVLLGGNAPRTHETGDGAPMHQPHDRYFCAPIPETWSLWFGWSNDDIRKWQELSCLNLTASRQT